MNGKYYAIKVNPLRPDFARTMTEEEKSMMQQHDAYWTAHMEKGMVHVFGPVLDPRGVYGFGLISAEDENEVKAFLENDPAAPITAFEYHPMLAVVAAK